MTKFILIRHGSTDDVGKKLSGRGNGVKLNADGKLQAEKIPELLLHLHVDHIFSSPQQRAHETATPLASKLLLPVQTDEHFDEIDFGEWTNMKLDQLKDNSSFHLFNTFRSNSVVPGGESMRMAQARIIDGIEQLSKIHSGKTIVIFSHADMIRAALLWYMGISLDLIERIQVSPASISILHRYPSSASVVLLNYTGGLK